MDAPPLTPLAAAVLHVDEPERALEIECGEGDGALFLAREFPRARVRGVDRSEQAVARARNRTGLDPEGRIAFKPGSPTALPFPDDHFDLLVAIDASPDATEAARVLRPTGFLALVATSRHRQPGLRKRLLQRSLAKRGVAHTLTERAGHGSFSLYRHEGAG